MKTLSKIFLLGLLTATLLGMAYGQLTPPYPVMKPAILQPIVSFDPTTQLFIYSYWITNNPQSTAKIDTFQMDIAKRDRASVEKVDQYENPDLLAPGDLENGNIGNLVIHVAFRSVPQDWDVIGTGFGLYFSICCPRNEIQPGETQGPFVIVSKGLVGARNFLVQQLIIPAELPDPNDARNVPPGETPQDVINRNVAIIEGAQFTGPTIGPVGPPQNCDLPCLIDFLSQEKDQAFNLGWIDNQGVANSLDAKLKEVKIKLQAGQTKVAGNILKSFILDLIAQHQGQTGQGQGQGNPQGKHVNDNAFYLLKPNAEFILYKLGQL